MFRQIIQEGLESIRPDEESKARMLQNILSASSERPPSGKDDTMKRKNVKTVVIAAVIALMVIMMGCAVVALNLNAMKLGDVVIEGRTYQDAAGTQITEPDEVRTAISLQGFNNSPGQLAAQEWLAFRESYDQDHKLVTEADNSGYEAPDEYDAYDVYTQEMIDKVDEIAGKYGLKLAGESAVAQAYQNDIMFDALGIEQLHHLDADVEVEYGSGSFYECGDFYADFWVSLTGENADWPNDTLVSMRYCDKEYMNTLYFTASEANSQEQWNYTTADGTEILIVMGTESAWMFCDREDAFISVSIDVRCSANGTDMEYMTKQDVEMVADVIDFSVKPQKPDMESAKQELAITFAVNEAKRQQAIQNAEDLGFDEFIEGRLEKMENPEELYFILTDIDADGAEDLLLGSKEQFETAWMTVYTQETGTELMDLIPLTNEEQSRLEAGWKTMGARPITEYPLD